MNKDYSKSQAGCAADNSIKDEILSVSHHDAKPCVSGRQSESSPEITYDEYAQLLKKKSYDILYSLNGMSVEQAKRVLQMASENLDLSATVDLKFQAP